MNKWETYQILKEDEHINSSIPETRVMSEQNVVALLSKYGTLILKPVMGSGGRGVVNISPSEEHGSYVVQVKTTKHQVAKHDLYPYVTNQILKGFAKYIDSDEVKKILAETYLVQKRIPLAEINNCPFDIRVMVQRKNDLPWKVTGKLVKLASAGYSITNVNLGATILPLEIALQQSSIHHLAKEALIFQLDEIALLAVECLQKHYPTLSVIGFDMCFDTQGNVWIIEANNVPDDYIFLELEDKTMYNTIKQYR